MINKLVVHGTVVAFVTLFAAGCGGTDEQATPLSSEPVTAATTEPATPAELGLTYASLMTEGDRAGALELVCGRLQAELKADGFLEDQGKPEVTEFRLGEQFRLGIYEGELTFTGGEKELVSIQETEAGFCLGER